MPHLAANLTLLDPEHDFLDRFAAAEADGFKAVEFLFSSAHRDAGVPQRHEPDLGGPNVAWLYNVIDEVSAACGWTGWVGCEYRPARGTATGGTSAGLRRWLAPLLETR